MNVPGLLTIMGSGETAPMMAKVHRRLLARLGPGPVPTAIVDTPYGFQENADDLTARTIRFFEEKLGQAAVVAGYRSRDIDPAAAAAAVAVLRGTRYVMAGPGSPSYALRHWRDGPIPDALADLLERGGGLTLASAAALTAGALTIPVYEIYKVGAPVTWLPGLDLLGRVTGLHAAIVPHYDNSEGGTHDTRFCYIGERRLVDLEHQVANSTFVLGVDSHTAVTFDLDARMASVAGRGGMTIRSRGRSTVFPSGSHVPITTIGDVAARLETGTPVDIGWEAPTDRRGSRIERPPIVDGAEPTPDEPPDPAPDGRADQLADDVSRIRGRLRAAGDFASADELRDSLIRAGFEVHDESAPDRSAGTPA